MALSLLSWIKDDIKRPSDSRSVFLLLLFLLLFHPSHKTFSSSSEEIKTQFHIITGAGLTVTLLLLSFICLEEVLDPH